MAVETRVRRPDQVLLRDRSRQDHVCTLCDFQSGEEMSRESLIRRALELQRLTKDARATLSLAAGEEATGDVLGFVHEIGRPTREFLSTGTKNVHHFATLQLFVVEVKPLLEAAPPAMA